MLAPRTLNGLLDIAAIPSEAMPASARAMARLSLYDWFAVARAGENEPIARIVRGLVADEGGQEAASVVRSSSNLAANQNSSLRSSGLPACSHSS